MSVHNPSVQVILPQRLAIVGKQVAQRPGQAEHELPQWHRWQHALTQPGGAFDHSSTTARRTEAAPLATERHQAVVAAGGAVDAGEAFLQIPAAQVRIELAMNERRERPAVGLAGIAHAGPIPRDAAVQDGLVRTAGFVGAGAVHSGNFALFSLFSQSE
jgi:hypothetical protein